MIDTNTREVSPEMNMKNFFDRRRERLRKLLKERGLDAQLVSLAANRFYLSGFELHDPQFNESAGHLVVCADGADWLATDGRYEEAAAAIWPKDRIFIYGGNTARDLVGLLRQCGARIGIEPAGVSWSFARRLFALQSGKNPVFEASAGLVEKLRVIKDEWELDCLKSSFRLNHQLFNWLTARLEREHKISERELSWEIERFFRENGAQELAFANIVASGKNAAMPHAIPEDKIIDNNVPLLVDIGCRVRDYCSDQTRAFWIGDSPSPKFTRTLELVQNAQKAAMAIMRPGVPCKDVYVAARQVFEKEGLASHFNHGLGHGVGLETHEAPSLSPRSDALLEKGMTVTVEPGLYFPEWGGVRWEHTVLVTDDGISVL